MKKSIIYCGSFDCFHNGHQNIVNRALKVFDVVYILVANNPKKKYLFDFNERINIIKHYFNTSSVIVDVLPESKLVSDYAKEKGINSILKGIRNIQDTEYEKMLHEVTVSQDHGIDTFILFSNPEDQKISSSAVKELIKFNADVQDYISLYTKQQLEIKQNGQYIIGITGGIATGKSFITELLINYFVEILVPVIHIDLDKISNDLTYGAHDGNQEIINLRGKVREMLNVTDSIIDLKPLLKEKVFGDKNFNQKLMALYKPLIIKEIRKRIYNKKGIIIINGALLIDSDLQYLCNNNVILTNSDNCSVNHRLDARYGVDDKSIYNRVDAQLSFIDKHNQMNDSIKHTNHGSIQIINNCAGNEIYDMSFESLKQYELIRLLGPTIFQTSGISAYIGH